MEKIRVIICIFLLKICFLSCTFGITKANRDMDRNMIPSDTKNQVCFLSPHQYLLIGCTSECGDNYKNAVTMVADKLNYSIRFVTLMNEPTAEVDAILSPGGGDILPEYYTKGLPSSLKDSIEKDYKELCTARDEEGKARDKFEFDFLSNYFANETYKNVPALGICYGMQMFGIVAGIPLYVDVERNIGIKARRDLDDEITFLPEAKHEIMSYLNYSPLLGQKNHHQALHYQYYLENKAKFPNVEIIATSNNGKIPEIIVFKNRPAIGIQFHAERSVKETKEGVFTWLLTKACEKKRLAFNQKN